MMWLHGASFITLLNVKVNEIARDDKYSEELLNGGTTGNVISQPIEYPQNK